MRIYISGLISGLPFPEVKAKLQKTQIFFEDLGYDVVNPTKNGLTESHTLEQHIVRDVELLLTCDAIYLFDGWHDSVGACIEHDIAMRMGKDVLFESSSGDNQKVLLRIKDAIKEVTGMELEQYAIRSRKIDYFYARMLFIYHCRQNFYKIETISKYVNRDHSSIIYSLKKWKDEIKYNKYFQELANQVDLILNKPNDDNTKKMTIIFE